ncbi:MAG: voltage-gated potassium channel [Natronomonas sp.]|uniref:potassium channel family protein n=1 Tax=Natronomonas sp. TaxID=2184060 RepID=UPI003989B95F
MSVSVFHRPLLKRAILPITVFLLVCVIGIAGFVYFEGVSLVVAAFWLLDPTSMELYGVGDDVRAFSLLVVISLILSTLWIGESVLGAVFGGQVQEELKRMQTKRHIDEMADHMIVCGYGSFGRTIANTLSNAGRNVVVIEQDEHRIEAVREDDIPAIRGDARMEGPLEEAGVEQAEALVGAIDDSNANIEIAILSSQLAPDVRVIVRVGNQRYSKLARRAGADNVIIPEIRSGQDVSQSIL